MTVAQFEAAGGTAEVQALGCFSRLKDFLDGLGQGVETASHLTVELARRDYLDIVMRVREQVFGDRRPAIVSNRFTRLPPGEIVRLTIRLDSIAAGGSQSGARELSSGDIAPSGTDLKEGRESR
ncbi:MAG TPA: hypothetical protein VHV79_07700 [Mycobacteriales bacterium]|nr:hypothetical protein [Mycobacteriales bacterium]